MPAETLEAARRRLGGDGGGDGGRRARRGSASTSAVAVTGIAGPGGGTPEKPVGLVYVHVETPGRRARDDFDYPGDRESIRRRATVAALHLARRRLVTESGQSLSDARPRSVREP